MNRVTAALHIQETTPIQVFDLPNGLVLTLGDLSVFFPSKQQAVDILSDVLLAVRDA